MLETIKNYIDNLPNITFEEYFLRYMMNVQDKNIGIEVDEKFKHVVCDAKSVTQVGKMIDNTYKELTKNDKCK